MDIAGAQTSPPRLYAHLLSVLTVPIFTTLVAGTVLLATDAMREALHIALQEQWDQLVFIGLALYLAAVGLRTSAEMLLVLASPAWHSNGLAGVIVQAIPKAMPVVLSLSVAIPTALLPSDPAWFAYVVATAFLLIGLTVAALGPTANAIAHVAQRERVLAVSLFVALILGGLSLSAVLFDFQNPLPETAGPIAIILLWVFCATVFFSPLSALASMARLPLLTLLFAYAVGLSLFDVNENHVIRGYASDTVVPTERKIWNTPDDELSKQFPLPSLAAWLDTRTDKDEYTHYPVFLVATEGGGMRAAYYTASVLGALQDQCPAFAEHIYAIGSVSGGSLGAASFAASVADTPAATAPTTGCVIGSASGKSDFRKRARTTFSADFLSPTLSATLFPDAFQRIVPTPIYAFDRARALEFAFERSWRGAQPNKQQPNFLAEPISTLYAGDRRDRVPRLYMLTTQVGTGDLVPFGNIERAWVGNRALFRQTGDQIFGASSVGLRFFKSTMVPLSTAAVLSARFPYLTPAGSLRPHPEYSEDAPNNEIKPEWGVVRLVDGGYFENSGTWFVNGVLQNLLGQKFDAENPRSDPSRLVYSRREELFRRRVANAQIIVLILRSTPCELSAGDDLDKRVCLNAKPSFEDNGLNEIMSPLRTMLNARDSRAQYSETDLRMTTAMIHQLCGFDKASGSCLNGWLRLAGDDPSHIVGRIQMALINNASVDVPLTWLLSERSRHFLDVAVDTAIEQEATKPGSNAFDQRLRAESTGIYGHFGGALCALAQRKGKEIELCRGQIPHTRGF